MLDVDGFMNNNSTISSNYSRKRADSESSFKPSRFNMSASLSNLPPIKDDDMSSSIANISATNPRPSSRTYSSFKSIFGLETKEDNQSSDL